MPGQLILSVQKFREKEEELMIVIKVSEKENLSFMEFIGHLKPSASCNICLRLILSEKIYESNVSQNNISFVYKLRSERGQNRVNKQ